MLFPDARLRRARSRFGRTVLSVTTALTVLTGAALPAAASVRGPDVSSYQHPNGVSIAWGAAHVTGGAAFAFVKATEGTDYTNPYFARDFAGLHAAGMVAGAYHFARPSAARGSAAAQANHFVAATGGLRGRGDLPGVLDLEVTGGLSPAALIAWTHQFLTQVQARTGKRPILYTYPAFWRSAMSNTTGFTSYPLWIATFGPSPGLVGGWRTYTFWQYTDRAHLPGVSAAVDMSVFNGSLAQLRALAGGAPAPAPRASAGPSRRRVPAPRHGTHRPGRRPGPRPRVVPPGTPTELQVSTDVGAATVTWAPPHGGGPVGYYQVLVDGAAVAALPASARSYTVSGLASAAQHTFTVLAGAPHATAVGSPASAAAVVPARSTLTLATSAPWLQAGQPVTVTVTAGRDDSDEPQPGAVVTLTMTPRNGPPVTQTVTTGPDGTATATFTPTVTADIVATLAARDAYTAAQSDQETVEVSPVLTLTRADTQTGGPGMVTLLVSTDPALAGQQVIVQRLRHGWWHTETSGVVDDTGHALVQVSASSWTRYFRAHIDGSDIAAEATSDRLAVHL